VLRNEDLTQTVLGFLDEEIEAIVDHAAARRIDEWDFDGLAADLHGLGLDGDDFDPTAAEFGVREESIEHLRERSTPSSRRARRSTGGGLGAGRALRAAAHDRQLWVDHLTELDDMRRGIGLRGYGGIDPLNEFKKEAFRLYEELRGFIRHQVATTIFRVSVEPAVQQQTVTSTDSGGSVTSAGGATRWLRQRARRSDDGRSCRRTARSGGRGRHAARRPAVPARRPAGRGRSGARARPRPMAASSVATTRAGAAAARSSSAATAREARLNAIDA
jgi:preprotein translocase subunit SecA